MINGTVLDSSRLSGVAGIRHGFFTRQGGVSRGLYGSLNCGLGSRDDREAVIVNRNRVAEHLGAAPNSVVTVYQVHSATALLIDRLFEAGAVPQADALVTATPGVVVASLAADCTPVLFADPAAGVVAAAHAGWRGALAGILEATLATMESAGARRSNIIAAIGPCIHQASYEMGPEVVEQFTAHDSAYERFFVIPTGRQKHHFDLPGFVHHRLEAAGVTAISPSPACTYRNADLYFSYRRATHCGEPDYGRQISAIVVA